MLRANGNTDIAFDPWKIAASNLHRIGYFAPTMEPSNWILGSDTLTNSPSS